MKVMVIVKATASSEAGQMPSVELLEAMGKFNEELAEAGIMLAGEGLKPSSLGARVRFSGSQRLVTDGPFAETNELVAGYWIWQVSSMDQAIEWVKRCPNPMPEDSEIEIRPVYGMEDFAETMTEDAAASHNAALATTLGLSPPRYEHGKPLTLTGTELHYRFEERSNIPAQWQQFMDILSEQWPAAGDTFGVCTRMDNDGFDYMCAVEPAAQMTAPDSFTQLQIPAQFYAVFPHEGHVSELPELIDKIWSEWLPQSGLKAVTAPSFERYTERFNPQTGTGGMELWLPVLKS